MSRSPSLPKSYHHRRRVYLPITMTLLICATSTAFGQLELFEKDNGQPFQVSSHSPNAGDAWPIEPGMTTVLADLSGPVVIRNMWFTCSGLPDPGQTYLRDLIVRMYWDHEDQPSVEAPFGDFFGCGFSRRTNWISPLLGVTSGGFYSYWTMPFREHGRIEIENTGDKTLLVFFHILAQRYDQLPEDSLYFHAQWRRENPTLRGKNYTILEATGDGYFAGVILYMQAYDKGDKTNFLEGDEFIYIDDQPEAVIKGTGGEDYFQGGWYFIDGTFNAPDHGLILKDMATIQFSCYRFHVKDRINFAKNIRVEIEHGNRPNNEARADFSSTAFWYQKEPHQPFAKLPSDRKPTVLKPAFLLPGAIEWEGTPNTSPLYVSTYNGGWSNNMGAVFAGPTGTISEKSFTVPSDGGYAIGANFITHDEGAIVQVLIDDQPVGKPIDTCTDQPRDFYLLNVNKPTGHLTLGDIDLKAGEHRVTLRIEGVNPKSKGNMIAVDCVTSVPHN